MHRFCFHSKHPSWDRPKKLLSTQALALSRDVSRMKQIAKANILFSSAGPAALSGNTLPAGASSGTAPPGGAAGTHTLLREEVGEGAVQGPHSPWGRFLLREQPREGTRGLPLLPAPLQGTGSVCALEGAQIPALFSSARQDTPRPPSPLPCPPPPSSGQPGLSHPGTRGRAYRSRGGARTRLAHPPRSPAVAVTTAPEEESGLCSNNVCVPAALPTV